MKTIKMELTYENCSEQVELPAKYEVCSRCEGEGKHSNPSIDGNGITSDEMEELGDDFRENYFLGVYDVRCECCGGERVELVVDESRLTPEQKESYEKHLKEEREYQREVESERRLFNRSF